MQIVFFDAVSLYKVQKHISAKYVSDLVNLVTSSHLSLIQKCNISGVSIDTNYGSLCLYFFENDINKQRFFFS